MTHKKTWPLLWLQFALVSVGKADCPYPEFKGNVVMSKKSILQNNFPEGSEVFLECANGFEREAGSTSVTCTGGMWSAVELTCKKKDCGEPNPSPHMTYDIKDGTLFGAYAKPTCERGYYLEGSSHRQCLVTGWSGRSKCSLITCDKPANITHGKIVTQLDQELVLDDVIEYSCDANYVLVGSRSITCNEDGEYSPPPPTCEVPEVTCQSGCIGIQMEGNPPYSYKSEATFKCVPGYSMKGLPTAVCEQRGWSAFPICVEDIKQQTTASMTTNIPTTTNSLNDIKQQTTASMTTNIPTTTNNLNDMKQQTTASMTTNIPINTNNLNGFAATFVIIALVAFFLICCCVFCLVHRHYKHKGSYDTGEELRTKEELLQNQCL